MPLDKDLVEQLRRVLDAAELVLPEPASRIDWGSCKAANWCQHTFNGYFEPLSADDDIRLDELLGIDKQKQLVEENTQQFLAGFPANNMLLWGSRGTGKSSLIRAVLNSYADRGLRVIQVDKDDLCCLPDIFSKIKRQPYHFLIFCDDLSFEPGDRGYKVLKSALDGSVYAAPKNTLIYVTSNRRYLIPEYATDNLGGKLVNNEVHHGEGVEQKLTLSARFGLWVAFHAFSQEQYLEVVRKNIDILCRNYSIDLQWDEKTQSSAISWSHEKSKRCGRTALQFSRWIVGRHMLLNSKNN